MADSSYLDICLFTIQTIRALNFIFVSALMARNTIRMFLEMDDVAIEYWLLAFNTNHYATLIKKYTLSSWRYRHVAVDL